MSKKSFVTCVLFTAASNGHSAVVKLLIKKKADLNCRNCRGQTALHLALKYGYTDVAELLVGKVRASELSGEYSFRLQFPR